MTESLIHQLARAYAATTIPHPELKAATLAQWLLESGRGGSALARDHLNFAGLRWRGEMAGLATPVDYPAHDGTAAYCAFASLLRSSPATGRFWRGRPMPDGSE